MEASWDYVKRLARRSEEIGFDLSLIAELNLNDIKGVDAPSLDAWSTAAALTVNYAVGGQGAPGLTVGQWKQTQVPKMDRDIVDLIETRKIPVFVVEEDVAERGIGLHELVVGVELISRKSLPALFAGYEVVSHW